MIITPATDSNLVPEVHLTNAAVDNPNVVIVGDSISTLQPTIAFDETDSLWGVLQREMMQQNPGRNISFYNRAIGGARWDHFSDNKFPTLNSVATVGGLTLPVWSDGSPVNPLTDSWLDAVIALEPHVLFFHFGMNDQAIFVEANFQDVMNDVKNYLPNTDIVFITNMVPHFYNTSNPGTAGKASQNGRLFVAERVRSHALYHGFGMIDIGRNQCRKVAGFDPCLTSLERTTDAQVFSTPVTLGETEADFGVIVDFTVAATTWDTRLKLELSADNPNAQSWLEIYDDGGNLAVEFATLDNTQGRYLNHTSTVTTPLSGNMKLSVFVRGSHCRIEVNDAQVFDGLIKRHGGVFEPALSFLDGRSVSATVTYYPGKFLRIGSQISFSDMFGDSAVPDSQEGGNDLNHPTSYGSAVLFGEVLRNVNLRLPTTPVVNGTLGSSASLGVLADDSSVLIPVPSSSGTFTLWANTPGVGATVHYNTEFAPKVLFSQEGVTTQIAVQDTALAGTTGTDGFVTISVTSAGIYVENRRGLQMSTARYLFQHGV